MAKRTQRATANNTVNMPQARYSLDERRKVIEEGVDIVVPTGVAVRVRPVTPDGLLRTGKIPDTVTPIMLKALYEPDKAQVALDEFVQEPRQTAEEMLTMLTAIDAVCEASLVDTSQLPYLTFQDKGFIFRMAFLPAEVLSRFRSEPARDVGRVDDGNEVRQVAVRNSGRGQATQQPGALPAQ